MEQLGREPWPLLWGVVSLRPSSSFHKPPCLCQITQRDGAHVRLAPTNRSLPLSVLPPYKFCSESASAVEFYLRIHERDLKLNSG